MSITQLRPDDYFAAYNPDGTLKGYFRLSSIHVAGKSVHYRTLRWWEWLWCYFVLSTSIISTVQV